MTSWKSNCIRIALGSRKKRVSANWNTVSSTYHARIKKPSFCSAKSDSQLSSREVVKLFRINNVKGPNEQHTFTSGIIERIETVALIRLHSHV